MRLPIAILAGGLATRLRPLTERVPKALLDVCGKPFIERQLELLKSRGVERVVLCLGFLGEMVRDRVGDGGRWGLAIDYSFDGDKLLGTGGSLRRALPLLGDAFMVMYGDSYLDCDYAAVEQAFLASGRIGLMTVLENDNRWDRSNILYRQDRILSYDKRNPTDEMRHIDYGLGALSAKAFDRYVADDGPIDLALIYQGLLASGELAGFEVTKRFYEIGSHEGLEETRRFFADNKERST